MVTLGPIGFVAPWLLLGLLALPILWILLRAVPPAPLRRRFPAIALLIGLRDEDAETDRTPWWLLLLRMLAVAGLILGLSGPVINPRVDLPSSGPLLILADASWADARTWEARRDRIGNLIDDAERSGRQVALATLTATPGLLEFRAPELVRQELPGLQPNPWSPMLSDWTKEIGNAGASFDTAWLSDGIDHAGRADLARALAEKGSLTVYEIPQTTFGLLPPRFEDGTITLSALRTRADAEAVLSVAAIGPDPAGSETVLATVDASFATGETSADIGFSLPAELRNRITRFEATGQRSAASVVMVDDSLRRREIGLIAASGDREGLELLSPLHYLRQALAPNADIVDGSFDDLLLANPDVIVMADVATLAEAESEALIKWIEDGGLLVRFAGPRLAAANIDPGTDDPLLPVRLRAGGRSVGGAMSWGDPKQLAPFPEGTPFAGLAVPEEVTVTTQVMAQPDPTLADRVIAQLTDGTPLVTRKPMGAGSVVLFHVTANSEWSNLPLSGLFVQMLERLAVLGMRPLDDMTELAGTTWLPAVVLTAEGRAERVDTLPSVTGERLATGVVGADMPPGLYAGQDRKLAVNVLPQDATLAAAVWPAGTRVEGISASVEHPLGGWLLGFAALALLTDLLATMGLSGRFRGAAAGLGLAVFALFPAPAPLSAQTDDAFAIAATSGVVLAHVLTGDSRVDDTAAAGLRGLSDVLFLRTSIEPAEPIGVDIESDELSFFPLLYWPISDAQPLPSRDAYAKLNRYLRSGGLILFDTRDADRAGFGSATSEGRMLQAIARGLDIPPLEPVPSDHVLTRTFYLLQDFPGRYAGREIWVEASPPGAAQSEGMPFRNLNDGVTPVIIGGNDWASAWATDDLGVPLFRVGRGSAGDRQREIAFRFGVNVVMHVLTGNYKSDQVHVPALLDRLGQ